MTHTLDHLDVFVPGDPKPQGSKRPFRNPHSGKIQLVESSTKVKTWRGDIRDALLNLDRPAIGGPVAVRLAFVMARPKSHYRTGRNAHLLRDTAPKLPAGKPDIDKLARAVLDAISSAGVWGDDCQVTSLHATKIYGWGGSVPARAGVRIIITTDADSQF